MKRVMCLIGAGMLMFSAGGFAHIQEQQINDEALKTELRIVKSIIKELFREEKQSGYDFVSTSTGDVEAFYYKGHGLVIYPPKYQEAKVFTIYDNDLKKGVFVNNQKVKSPNTDSLVEVRKKNVTIAMETYMTNYAKLFSYLNEGEKIQIIYDRWIINKGYVDMAVLEDPNNKGSKNFKGVSSEIGYADIKALKEGTLKEVDFKKRIKFKYGFSDEARNGELEIMAKIMKNLIQNEDNPMRNYTNVTYHRMEGFGVTFDCDIYYSDKQIVEGNRFQFEGYKNGTNYIFSSPDFREEVIYEFKRSNDSKTSEVMVVPAKPAPSLKKRKTQRMREDDHAQANKEMAKSQQKKAIKEHEAALDLSKKLKNEQVMVEIETDQLNAEINKMVAETASSEKGKAANQEKFNREVLANLKAGLIKYGATLSSLAQDEIIILNLKFKSINSVNYTLSVKRNIISDYEKGKINLEDAVSKINVE